MAQGYSMRQVSLFQAKTNKLCEADFFGFDMGFIALRFST
jgi:hypothetical protein